MLAFFILALGGAGIYWALYYYGDTAAPSASTGTQDAPMQVQDAPE